MKHSRIYFILLTGTFLWCLLIFVPALASFLGFSGVQISNQIYRFYSHVCHQYDSRSIHIFGTKLAVCARCTGIYLGFLIGTFTFLFISIKRSARTIFWLAIAALLMLFDIFFNLIGVHSSNIFSRFTTGLFFGVIVSRILVPIIIEAISEYYIELKTTKGVKSEYKA